ncbi:MAG TPA: 3-oxoacyl-ACP reductase FabG [Vicinamibacterales bacterium]|nr:3-oxoacyl-ACP reductase FabG [Vicinamibacterales bacterium]
MFDLTGKVAIVTGGSRGIGKAIALGLSRQGAAVVIADVLGEAAVQTAAEIAGAGGQADGAEMDVTSAESVRATVERVVEQRGRVDILVNNAGIARDQLLMRMKREEWDAVLNINLTGAFTCTHAVLRQMMRQRSGRIISISSVVGQMGNAGQVNYAASKAGLIGFTKALAREVANRAVTVNAVAPGLIDTDMTRALSEDVRNEWAAKVPLGRLGSPEDVAWTVAFLASDEASYITGQVIAVNGGMYT